MATSTIAHAEMDATVAALDDQSLVFVMLGLLSAAPEDAAPLFGGQNENGAMTTRIVFTEIAHRWIPPDVFGGAFNELGMEDADNG